MRILGIDPGFATIGYGLIQYEKNHVESLDYGYLSTPKEMPHPERLDRIAHDMAELCEQWKPDICAIEQLFFSKNVTNGLQVAEARGVILQTLNRARYPIVEYNPQQIKMALTGDGRATKPQIQKMVSLLLKLKSIPRPDDAADALAIALCHAHTSPLLHPSPS